MPRTGSRPLTSKARPRRPALAAKFAIVAMVVGSLMAATGASAATEPCAAPVANPVACENTKTGSPSSQWDVSGSGSSTIQGFPTQISVNLGERVNFKIKTPAQAYRLDIYRMGYYAGSGARLIATVAPSASLPQTQPNCLSNGTTGLVDCGNWAVSAGWDVPGTAVSGIYFAKLVRTDGTAGSSHVVFVVRDDARSSDLLFQTSDTTWQAYNQYGGNSLYVGSPAGRAYKVSYNRPITTRGTGAEDAVFNAEYPMVRFLEANGYDVSYFSGADTDRRGSLLQNHKTFLSVGHDEYWSGAQRTNIEAARDAGVNLAFFSGNEVFWKTRWENAIDGSGTPYRTLVCYKDTHANASIDPLGPSTWTGTWRDPRFSPPGDGGRPENALTGTAFEVNSGTVNLRVPAADGKMRFWRGTPVATQAAGATATLGTGTVGYEWDEDPDNGYRPAGQIRLSTTTAAGVQILTDYGSSYGSGSATHNLTLYRAASGALVFGAGTVQWSWGLDSSHDRGSGAANASMRQATVNLFADMGVQPATLSSGLVLATSSTDTTGPAVTISSPTAGSSVQSGAVVTVSGTAADSGGGVVGGIEVSTDGGTTWHPATGRGTWSYSWTPGAAGSATIRARASDDSANIGAVASVAVTVGARSCPCSVWNSSAAPTSGPDPDTASTEVGVKFRSDTAGQITGIRFYKGAGNTGTHIGHFWTSTGTSLGSVTFTGESGSGWQQANFASPISIAANTTYVASYLAPNGRYSADTGTFATAGIDAAPLNLLRDGVDGPNGVYGYFGASGGFPTLAWESANYWVDVVFSSGGGGGDSTPPTVTARTPASGATGVATTTSVTATFSEPLQAGTAAVTLTGPGAAAVAGATSYDAAAQRVTFTPTAALAAGTSYTATVSGARDAAGNVMAPTSWTFSTAAGADTTPPTVTARTPASGAAGVATTTTVTATFSEPLQASTAALTLAGPGGTSVAGTTAYDTAARRATFTPSAPLANSTPYTATASGAKDTAGNTMTATLWSFTTATATQPPTCPCSVWPSTATPANPAENDTAAVEVGMKFRSDVAGTVTGVRFYKGAGNTGTHVGHLWSRTGTSLGTVTFTGETASGWQQANFATPVAISANTTYVISYYAPVGRYAADEGFFATGVDRAPLHALGNGVDGANGVYRYGSGGGFPSSSYQSTNYWVDIVFTAT